MLLGGSVGVFCVKSAQISGDFIGRTPLPVQFRKLSVTLAAPWFVLVQGNKCQCCGVLRGAGENVIRIVPQVPLSVWWIFL